MGVRFFLGIMKTGGGKILTKGGGKKTNPSVITIGSPGQGFIWGNRAFLNRFQIIQLFSFWEAMGFFPLES